MPAVYVDNDVQDQSVSTNVASSTHTITYSGTDRGTLAVVSANRGAVRALTSVTLNSVTGTIIGEIGVDGGQSAMMAFVFWDESESPSTTGSYDLVATWSGSVTDAMADVITLNTVDQTTPYGTLATNSAANSTSLPLSLGMSVSSASGELLITAAATVDPDNPDDPPVHTKPSQATLLSNVTPGFSDLGFSTAYDAGVDSDSENYDWSLQHATGLTEIQASVVASLVINGASASTYTLSADSGTYSQSGTAAGLIATRQLAASSGSYSHAGTDASLTTNRVIAGDSGTFTQTGTSADLIAYRVIACASGTYTHSGTDATLTYTPAASDYTLTCDSGTYIQTGTSAGLIADRTLDAESGTYSHTGTAADLFFGYRLTAESGTYTQSGTSAGISIDRLITAVSGTYSQVGSSITFTYSGTAVWTDATDSVTAWADISDSSDSWSLQTNSNDTWTVQ